MRHGLLVVGAIGRQRVARGVERFADSRDIAVAEDREHALEQALLTAVGFDLLGAEEANHRLCGGQADRCHGPEFPALMIVLCLPANVASSTT